MSRTVLLLVCHALALWPVVDWYVRRASEVDTDFWGLAALAAAVVLTITAPRHAPGRVPRLAVPAALLVAFVLSWPFVPHLIGAAIGMASFVALVSEIRFGTRMQPALLGLSLMAVTSISTLQFFVGWPFRVAVAAVVAPVLTALGADAASQGTSIVLGGQAIAVDAPCSGVWMAWAAVLVGLTVSLARRLSLRATVTGLLVCVPVVFAANALRTLCLVLVETRRGIPEWTHAAVGVVVLAAAALVIVRIFEGRTRCAPQPSI